MRARFLLARPWLETSAWIRTTAKCKSMDQVNRMPIKIIMVLMNRTLEWPNRLMGVALKENWSRATYQAKMKKESRLRAEWKCVKSTITNHLSPDTTLTLSIESWDRLLTPEAWRKIQIRALDHLSESMHNTYQLRIFRAKRKSSSNIMHNRSKQSHHQ